MFLLVLTLLYYYTWYITYFVAISFWLFAVLTRSCGELKDLFSASVEELKNKISF